MIKTSKKGIKYNDTNIKTRFLQVTLREAKSMKTINRDNMVDNTIFPAIYVEKSKVKEFVLDIEEVINKYNAIISTSKKISRSKS
jgi:hypothetical protein